MKEDEIELKEYSVVFRWTKEECLNIMAYNSDDAKEQVEGKDFDESNFDDAKVVKQEDYMDIVVVGEPELVKRIKK